MQLEELNLSEEEKEAAIEREKKKIAKKIHFFSNYLTPFKRICKHKINYIKNNCSSQMQLFGKSKNSVAGVNLACVVNTGGPFGMVG